MANKSVRKDDSEPKYRIEFMYKEYDGEYTAEECGKNVEVMLKDTEPTRLYNPHFTFYRTDAGFTASTKKSKKEQSFSEMVQKQRNKNRVQKSGEVVNELVELHRHLDKAWDELADALNLISDSAHPELQEFSNKCDEYCNAVGMLCLDVKDKLDKRWMTYLDEE